MLVVSRTRAYTVSQHIQQIRTGCLVQKPDRLDDAEPCPTATQEKYLGRQRATGSRGICASKCNQENVPCIVPAYVIFYGGLYPSRLMGLLCNYRSWY